MTNRDRVYVCFDSYNDFRYYQMMQTWKRNHDTHFNFYHGQNLNKASEYNAEEEIKRELRKRIQPAKSLVVLIGESTRYLHKFVQWEMEQALDLDLPIIGVNLNGLRGQDIERCPFVIHDKLAVYISFNAVILDHALSTWPKSHVFLKQEGKTGPYYYPDNIYEHLGLQRSGKPKQIHELIDQRNRNRYMSSSE
ncbi:molecular chaperone Tir [Candidatus Poribacteria bacterium]|nr:MAG: molecular chaperone Tir [Candidatus Poribacteria bacterium]